MASASAATRALPKRRLAKPPATQPMAPMAITAKAGPDTLPPATCPTSSGTRVQKAYSSHWWPK